MTDIQTRREEFARSVGMTVEGARILYWDCDIWDDHPPQPLFGTVKNLYAGLEKPKEVEIMTDDTPNNMPKTFKIQTENLPVVKIGAALLVIFFGALFVYKLLV